MVLSISQAQASASNSTSAQIAASASLKNSTASSYANGTAQCSAVVQQPFIYLHSLSLITPAERTQLCNLLYKSQSNAQHNSSQVSYVLYDMK